MKHTTEIEEDNNEENIYEKIKVGEMEREN